MHAVRERARALETWSERLEGVEDWTDWTQVLDTLVLGENPLLLGWRPLLLDTMAPS